MGTLEAPLLDATPLLAHAPDDVRQRLSTPRAAEILALPAWNGNRLDLLPTFQGPDDPVMLGWIAAWGAEVHPRDGLYRFAHTWSDGVCRHALEAQVAVHRARPDGVPWTRILGMIGVSGEVPESLLALLVEQLPGEGDRVVQLTRALGEPALAALRALPPDPYVQEVLREATPARDVPEGLPDDTLGRLLAAWAVHRHPDLARAIERTTEERPAPTGRTKAAVEACWKEIASQADPHDVPRLLAAPWPGDWRRTAERLEALSAFPPDPRIGRSALEASLRFDAWAANPLVLQAVDLARRCADRSLEGLARQLAGARRGEVAITCVLFAAELARLPVGEPEESLPRDPAPSLDGLWAAFWDDPRDAAARLVLADALVAAGDPRGELVQLQEAQRSGKGTAAIERRVSALIREHMDVLTGGLPGVDRKSCVFEGGFLHTVRLTAAAEALVASVDDRAWRTVRRLVLGPKVSFRVAPLVRSLPLLEAVICEPSTLAWMPKDGPLGRIREVGVAEGPLRPVRDGFPDAVTLHVTWGGRSTFALVEEAVDLGFGEVVLHRFPPHDLDEAERLDALAIRCCLVLADPPGPLQPDAPAWRLSLGAGGPWTLTWEGSGRPRIPDGNAILRRLPSTATVGVDPLPTSAMQGLLAGVECDVRG
ncbi:MAG: hypothetical protein H6736_13775 [Alphaproteobacteria bacterium]|nr:hypothetical protein [Alphaproteobacteria bacterium]